MTGKPYKLNKRFRVDVPEVMYLELVRQRQALEEKQERTVEEDWKLRDLNKLIMSMRPIKGGTQ